MELGSNQNFEIQGYWVTRYVTIAASKTQKNNCDQKIKQFAH